MNGWHVPPDVLERYAAAPASTDATTASSIEQHVLACGDCRSLLATVTDRALLDRSWSAIAERVDAPRPRAVETVLRRVGVDDRHARLVAATPALRASSLAGVVAVVGGLLALSIGNDDPGPFLVFAPVLPLAAVAAAFLPGAEPSGEAGRATPLAGLGLVLRRAAALLVPCLALVSIAALVVPGGAATDAAWVLPSLGLAAGAVALSSWLRVEIAAGALAATWLAALAVASARQQVPTSELAPLSPVGQLVWIAVAIVAVGVITTRRAAFAVESEVR